ncbi:GRIM-19 protein-domain-containing protein [Gorgonomyces haynaldii]|nr:GRIM-19 protein-domain-containing protein [Gorgonomyces haynaldii]
MQDAPPAGGFPTTIRYQRYLPRRGPSGAVILLATIGVMSWGFAEWSKGTQERRELKREEVWSRIYLTPLLQAETDRDYVRRMQQIKKREEEIMGQGWQGADLKAPVKGLGKNGLDPEAEEPVYHTKRYVRPTYVLLPEDAKIDAQWWRGSKMFTKNPPYHERQDFTKESPLGN